MTMYLKARLLTGALTTGVVGLTPLCLWKHLNSLSIQEKEKKEKEKKEAMYKKEEEKLYCSLAASYCKNNKQ